MGRTAQVALCCLWLTGCATGPTVPSVVRVPVPVSCLKAPPPDLPQTHSEAEIFKMTEYEATVIVWIERLQLRAYSEKAEALLLACR